MADELDDLTTKAALAAGKDAARRAVEDLLSSDEEKAQKQAEQAAASKSRRNKLIAFGVVGLLILVGLFGMVVSYWQWFFLAGLLGVVGLYGWYRLRKRFAGKKAATKDDAAEVEGSAEQERPIEARVDEQDAEAVRERAAKLREERAREALAREEAQAIEQQEIEDELAAMKARLDK